MLFCSTLQSLVRAYGQVPVRTMTVRAMSNVAMSRLDKDKFINFDALEKNLEIVRKR